VRYGPSGGQHRVPRLYGTELVIDGGFIAQ
jgi:hypothetical protein